LNVHLIRSVPTFVWPTKSLPTTTKPFSVSDCPAVTERKLMVLWAATAKVAPAASAAMAAARAMRFFIEFS